MGNKIGARLRELRRRASLRQEDLADKIGVTTKTLQRWEAGETSPRASDVSRICEVLGVTEAELLTGLKEEDVWKLTITMGGVEEMVDFTSGSISDLELSRAGAALRIGGSYALFEDDAKFEDFISQLRSARDLVIETGRKMKGIGNNAEG